jgi:sugar lactone lactonase YvrE
LAVIPATAVFADAPPTFVTAWGNHGSGDGQFDWPRGITVTPDGFVYTTEIGNRRVQKFTRDGVFVTKWGTYGSGDGQFNYPIGVAVDSEGDVYVADHANHRIQKFTANGTFITKWGSKGTANGQFGKPTGIAIDDNGDVYITEYDGGRIQKFTSSGQFITKWSGTEGGGPGYYRPFGIAVDHQGFIYVAEYGGNRVRKLNPDGNLLVIWGSYGTDDSEFNAPTGLCLDKTGNIYVADHVNHRVQKFSNDGQFLTKWGTYGSGPGEFAWVSGVAVDEENYIYTAGYVNHRVQKFVYPMAIRVTAEVRPEHDDGPFVVPAPPLTGVKVKLMIGENEWEVITDDQGLGRFPAAPDSSGIYEISLSGPAFEVRVCPNFPCGSQVGSIKEATPVNATADTTHFLWPHEDPARWWQGAAIQAAYFVEKFRRTFWLEKLGYEWTLPTLAGQNSNAMGVVIYDYNLDLQGKGGAGVEDEQQTLRFLRRRGEEADIVYHEYGHAVITDRFVALTGYGRGGILRQENDEGHALDEALADYFAASFTGDPIIARCAELLYPSNLPGCNPLRNIGTADIRYPSGEYRYTRYQGSLIVSRGLWDLRSMIGPQRADSLVFAALDTLVMWSLANVDTSFTLVDFFKAVARADSADGGTSTLYVQQAFADRNIPPVSPVSPLTWLDDDAFTAVEEDGQGIKLIWRSNPSAGTYDLWMNAVDFVPGGALGDYVLLQSGIVDTSFILSMRDPETEYAFTVVAVDSTGQPGYMANPAVVGALDLTGVDDGEILPSRLVVSRPNPSRGRTAIGFQLGMEDVVGVAVFDANGGMVRNLGRQRFEKGRGEVVWDGLSGSGSVVAPGVYFVRVTGSGWAAKGKIVLLR